MPRIEVPFFGDVKRYPNVKVGDLVTVAIYDSPRGEMMVASPDWLTQPGLPNSKSRTRAVSALVVDSRSAPNKPLQSLLKVIIDDQQIMIPAACVVEVMKS